MSDETIKNTTKESFIKHLESISSYGSISKACNLVGRSRQTIYDWRKLDNEFNKAVIEAVITGKSLLADLAEEALIGRIKASDTTAIIFALKNLRKDYYGEKFDKREEDKKESETKEESGRELSFPEDVNGVLFYTSFYLIVFHNRFKEAGLVTPELSAMFDDLQLTIKRHRELIKSR